MSRGILPAGTGKEKALRKPRRRTEVYCTLYKAVFGMDVEVLGFLLLLIEGKDACDEIKDSAGSESWHIVAVYVFVME